jgi:hypothetical protein
VRDALVRLVLKKKATDEGMGVLVRRFPAVVAGEELPRRRAARVDGRGAARNEQPVRGQVS